MGPSFRQCPARWWFEVLHPIDNRSTRKMTELIISWSVNKGNAFYTRFESTHTPHTEVRFKQTRIGNAWANSISTEHIILLSFLIYCSVAIYMFARPWTRIKCQRTADIIAKAINSTNCLLSRVVSVIREQIYRGNPAVVLLIVSSTVSMLFSNCSDNIITVLYWFIFCYSSSATCQSWSNEHASLQYQQHTNILIFCFICKNRACSIQGWGAFLPLHNKRTQHAAFDCST